MTRWSILFFLLIQFVFMAMASEPSEFNLSSEFKLKDLNRRAQHPVGFNLYGFGPMSGAGITMDAFITPKFAFETGAGFRDFDLNHAFTIGARYHLLGKTMLNLTPYIGIYTAFHYNGTSLQNHAVYIPVGIHRIKKNGFCWSAEIAWQRNVFNGNHLSGGFRIGYRFKKRNK
ncbi:MAG: hypothetical protein IPH66_03500 [Crocinitomicaceae bacterium]|nr:hypothetical protein [Crocinitomicaceae bacterium]